MAVWSLLVGLSSVSVSLSGVVRVSWVIRGLVRVLLVLVAGTVGLSLLLSSLSSSPQSETGILEAALG